MDWVGLRWIEGARLEGEVQRVESYGWRDYERDGGRTTSARPSYESVRVGRLQYRWTEESWLAGRLDGR